MDSCKLSLKNMIFYGHHGVYSFEKEFGQRIEVDLELWADFFEAAHKDNIDNALNYVSVYDVVRDVVEKQSFDLIEGLSQAICDQVAGKYSFQKIIVRVRKPQPPAGGLIDTVEFEICRER
jgi:dihydroneopterin aldolase